ncbi:MULTISPECIES: hypothetical protein [Streptomyces]|uniref:hypothetical protein n=1 Tax=Streptomyces TaxID=1883 RepID=UPI00142E27EC|nr:MULTISPECIES: hypothetical protein [Streptomyces]
MISHLMGQPAHATWSVVELALLCPGPVHPGPVHPGPVHPGPVHPGPVQAS